MNESGFIQKVKRNLSNKVHKEKFSDKFKAGIPDCWYSGPKGDIWIEYKYSLHPHRKPNLSRHQQQWLRKRHLEGRNVAVVVGSTNGAVIYPGVEWADYKTKSVLVPFEDLINWIHGETL